MKYYIGAIGFNTKDASYAYVKARINALGVCVIEPNNPDYQFLKDLSKQAPLKFEIVPSPLGRKGFALILHDSMGSHAKSWVKFARFQFVRSPGRMAEKLAVAMRNSVKEQVFAFKDAHRYDRMCQECKSTEDLHADHIIPFDYYKKEFLATNTLPLPTDFVDDDCYLDSFMPCDADFESAWREYHNNNATFQFLCAPCNIKKSNNINCQKWIDANRDKYNAYHKLYRRNKKAHSSEALVPADEATE